MRDLLITRKIALIHGIGGIGKSALAAEVAIEFAQEQTYPDGIVVINCQNPRDGIAQAPDLVRAALSRFGKISEDTDPASLASTARALLRGKQVLIILDNVEPQLPVGDLVRPLQDAGATLLITARQDPPAGSVPPAAIVVLDALPPDAARALFRALFDRPATDTLIDPIIAALGGHTLAITLMAPYARDTHPDLDALARALRANPRLAFAVHGDDPSRDLAPVFALSVDALPSSAQRIFAALAFNATTNSGRGAVLALAAAVGIAETEREDALRLLGRRGLVTVETDITLPDTSDRERITLHPLLRTYATERLATWTASDRDAAISGLIAWYAGYTTQFSENGAVLQNDEANIIGAIDAAIAQHDDEHLAQLCYDIMSYWRDRSRIASALLYLPTGRDAADRLAAASGTNTDRRRAAYIAALYGDILYNTGRLTEAEPIYRHDLEERRAIKDRRGEGFALSNLAKIAQARGQLDAAETAFRQGIAVLESVKNYPNVAAMCSILGAFLLAHDRGAPGEGCQLLAQAAQLYDVMGIPGAEEARALMQQYGCPPS